ncbi:MAG: helix-turn-helix domain-containing protein [Sulfuricella sp.]
MAKRARLFKPGEITLFRKALNLNQIHFWVPLGVTQSAGSRYEQESRMIPHPVATLIELMYGDTPIKTLARLRGVTEEELKRGN